MIKILRQLRRCVLFLAASSALACFSLVASDATPSVLAAFARLRGEDGAAEGVTVLVGAAVELVPGEDVTAAVVSDPETASAVVSGARAVRVSGLAVGRTTLIVSTARGRRFYAVSVLPRPRAPRPRTTRGAASRAPAAQGAYGFTVSRPAASPSLSLAHTFDYRQPLGSGRTLLASADFLSGVGSAQRVGLALETQKGSLELLDSDVTTGMRDFGGLRIRGARYRAAAGSRWDGLDLHAGSAARPGGGAVLGAFVPVFRSRSVLVRAGALRWDALGEDPATPQPVADLRYSPDERTTLAAEISGLPGRAAWSARLDLRRDFFDVAAEARQGRGSSGARSFALSAALKPVRAVRASVRWHHADGAADGPDSSSMAASLGYSFKRTNLNLTLGRVRSNATAAPASTAYVSAAYYLNLNRWSSMTELRASSASPSSRSVGSLGQTQLTSQLLRQFGGWSVGGSYKYLSRDEEGGRSSRAQEAGANLRAAFDRVRLDAGAYYRVFEPGSSGAHGFRASGALSYRLDNSTQLRFGFSQTFAPGAGAGPAGFTFSLTRRFGFGSAGDLNPLRLFRRGGGSRLAGVVFLDLNGNGVRDAGEVGAANMVVSLDGGARTVKTDGGGLFRFDAEEGGHAVELVSDRLGVSLLATASTSRRVLLGPGDAPLVAFGITDAASLSGRVYNDVGRGADNSPGVGGVRLRLAGAGHVAEAVTNAAGLYSFSNVRPGPYTVEIVADSLPADFRLPGQLTWPLTLEPIERERLSVALVAERAIVGRVFADLDGDGAYGEGVDAPLEGVSVRFAGRESRSNPSGAFMLRGLPAGPGTLSASRGGVIVFSRPLQFGDGPATLTVLIPAR